MVRFFICQNDQALNIDIKQLIIPHAIDKKQKKCYNKYIATYFISG